MNLEAKIEQYKNLKRMKRQLEERLGELRLDIMRDLSVGEAKKGLVKQERKIISYDADLAMDIATTAQLTKEVVDEAAFEQAYLNGELSDCDLRDIRTVKIVEALVEVDENVS